MKVLLSNLYTVLSGQLVIDLELDKKSLKGIIEDHEIKSKLQEFPNLRSLKLLHFEDLQGRKKTSFMIKLNLLNHSIHNAHLILVQFLYKKGNIFSFIQNKLV